MATRSNIGIEYENGIVKYVYCHWDGYPGHNGEILFENYNTRERVEELINLGDISILDVTPKKTQDYFTWRGEDITIGTANNRDEAYEEEYCYIFSVKDGIWYIKGVEGPWFSKNKDGWFSLEDIFNDL